MTPGWAFLPGLLDVIAALIIFTLPGAVLVLVITGANTLSGVSLFPLAPLFQGLHDTPKACLWLYAMLFSTLVPTVLHVAIATFSILALPFFVLIDAPLPA